VESGSPCHVFGSQQTWSYLRGINVVYHQRSRNIRVREMTTTTTRKSTQSKL